MQADGRTTTIAALRCTTQGSQTQPLELIGEEPLLIRIESRPYAVVMRTPGEELFHAAGFCLSEGLVDAADDFATIGHCQDMDTNVVDIRLTPGRLDKVQGLLERKGFVSQTSCGICGKQMLEDMHQVVTPATSGFSIAVSQMLHAINTLADCQQYYQRTRGSHAAVLIDAQLQVLAFAEDVGRHNALDKAIGKALMSGKLACARILVLSSRISYELIQKAARAHLPVIISHSRPTALAAAMGKDLNMTLAFPVGPSELIVVCGENRVAWT